MPGDIAMQDASPVMGDDEETVECAERERRGGEEIHCRNRFPVVAEEGRRARFAGSGFRGAFRIQRNTVRSEMSKPSIRSSP